MCVKLLKYLMTTMRAVHTLNSWNMPSPFGEMHKVGQVPFVTTTSSGVAEFRSM